MSCSSVLVAMVWMFFSRWMEKAMLNLLAFLVLRETYIRSSANHYFSRKLDSHTNMSATLSSAGIDSVPSTPPKKISLPSMDSPFGKKCVEKAEEISKTKQVFDTLYIKSISPAKYGWNWETISKLANVLLRSLFVMPFLLLAYFFTLSVVYDATCNPWFTRDSLLPETSVPRMDNFTAMASKVNGVCQRKAEKKEFTFVTEVVAVTARQRAINQDVYATSMAVEKKLRKEFNPLTAAIGQQNPIHVHGNAKEQMKYVLNNDFLRARFYAHLNILPHEIVLIEYVNGAMIVHTREVVVEETVRYISNETFCGNATNTTPPTTNDWRFRQHRFEYSEEHSTRSIVAWILSTTVAAVIGNPRILSTIVEVAMGNRRFIK